MENTVTKVVKYKDKVYDFKCDLIEADNEEKLLFTLNEENNKIENYLFKGNLTNLIDLDTNWEILKNKNIKFCFEKIFKKGVSEGSFKIKLEKETFILDFSFLFFDETINLPIKLKYNSLIEIPKEDFSMKDEIATITRKLAILEFKLESLEKLRPKVTELFSYFNRNSWLRVSSHKAESQLIVLNSGDVDFEITIDIWLNSSGSYCNLFAYLEIELEKNKTEELNLFSVWLDNRSNRDGNNKLVNTKCIKYFQKGIYPIKLVFGSGYGNSSIESNFYKIRATQY